MKIAIDATNLKAGGGLTHLKQISRYFSLFPDLEIHIFGGPWIEEINVPNKHVFHKEFRNILSQEYFKWFKLKKLFKDFDLIFAPGGSFYSKSMPYVTMCRNMLVFENKERNRYFFSKTWLRLCLLEFLQLRSFKNSSGLIYISKYAKTYIEKEHPKIRSIQSEIIYHGISEIFSQKPKKQKSIDEYSELEPLRVLYVSNITYYKHQWVIAEAVKRLVNKGYPISIDFIGRINPGVKDKMERVLDNTSRYINVRGEIPYESIQNYYKSADLFIYGSTCENMPNIVVEAMAAGLPILSSHYGPMPEILKDGAVFMDPTQVSEVEKQLELLLNSPDIRSKISHNAYNYAKNYSWKKTTEKTIKFLKSINVQNQ